MKRLLVVMTSLACAHASSVPAPPPGPDTAVRISEERGEPFDAAMGDARCAQKVSADHPCRLEHVPSGGATLKVDAAALPVAIPAEGADLRVTRNDNSQFTKGFLGAILSVAMIGGGIGILKSTPDTAGGAILAPFGGVLLAVTGGVLGVWSIVEMATRPAPASVEVKPLPDCCQAALCACPAR